MMTGLNRPPTRPLRWVSASALARLTERFDALLAPWAQAWGLPPPQGEVTLLQSDDTNADPGGTNDAWQALSPSGPWVRLPATLSTDLTRELFGAADAPASSIACEVAQRATDALLAHLQTSLPLDAEEATAAAPRLHPEPGHWGVVCQWRLGLPGVKLKATTAWLHQHHWLPPQLPARPLPAVNWKEALASTPLTLRVDLGNTDVPVGDLLNLQTGDVVLMNAAIHDALTVHLPGTEVRLRAQLGQRDPHRAIQFTSTSAPPKP